MSNQQNDIFAEQQRENKPMKTLFTSKDKDGVIYLKDAAGVLIGRFKSFNDVDAFCAENDYQFRQGWYEK